MYFLFYIFINYLKRLENEPSLGSKILIINIISI